MKWSCNSRARRAHPVALVRCALPQTRLCIHPLPLALRPLRISVRSKVGQKASSAAPGPASSLR